MSKARQCIIKAAALRAQADKLEKVAALVGQDADDGGGLIYDAMKVGLGLSALSGVGALGLGALGGAAVQAARAARAAQAGKSATKGMLSAGTLALGGMGALGGAAYGARELSKNYEASVFKALRAVIGGQPQEQAPTVEPLPGIR